MVETGEGACLSSQGHMRRQRRGTISTKIWSEIGMPLRPMDREQAWLRPPTFDELLAQDHPARFVAAFVDGLNRASWAKIEIEVDGDPTQASGSGMLNSG